jgi:ADP-heptose:LPS heptosyltransferase
MDIAIAHLGNISQLIPATSVIRGIKKHNLHTKITWVVDKEESCYINKYNKDVSRTIPFNQFVSERGDYDLLVNLYPSFPESIKIDFDIRDSTGFYFHSSFDKFKKVFSENKESFDMNIFQLYFILSGLTWKGEGYDIRYKPKTKVKANKIGVSVANANIRNYVLDNLEIDKKKIWYIPYKKNIFKRMDEINRCKKIITDDLITFHLAMSMKKYVYYLETFPLSTKLELFNSGEICKVPMNII